MLKTIRSLDDFEAVAQRRLPAPLFGYIHAAADAQRATTASRAAFDAIELLPRFLRNVSGRSTEIELLGHRYASAFGIAPMGLSALFAYRGDLVMTEAARAANVPMIMSGSSLIPLEVIAKANPDAWFQAYVTGDMRRTDALVDRVIAAGFGTLVVTVDIQALPNLEYAIRRGFSSPLRPSLRLAWEGVSHPRWLLGTFLRTLAKHGLPYFENNDATRGVPVLSASVMRDFSDRGAFTFKHLAAIRKRWPGKLVVKGLLAADDARQAAAEGADGIIVSTHGARQLAGSRTSVRALPDIVEACPDLPVMLDSGVRRGTDVLKALALGARAVFVGRPFAYAAAAAGPAGVQRAIALMANEVSQCMGMLGLNSLADVPRDRIAALADHIVRIPLQE